MKVFSNWNTFPDSEGKNYVLWIPKQNEDPEVAFSQIRVPRTSTLIVLMGNIDPDSDVHDRILYTCWACRNLFEIHVLTRKEYDQPWQPSCVPLIAKTLSTKTN